MCEQPNRNILGYFQSQIVQLKLGHQKRHCVNQVNTSHPEVNVNVKTVGEVEKGNQ